MATIKDIATEIDVSHQVVSAVLNNKTNCRVSEEKRRMILHAAQSMGYSKNFGYRLMRGQSTRTVAIMLSETYMKSEEYVNDLIVRLMNKFNQLNYSVYSVTFTSSVEENMKKVRELISRGAEHFVFLGCPIGHLDIEQELENNGRSLVCFGGQDIKRHICGDSVYGVATILRFFLDEDRNFRLVCPFSQLDENNSRVMALQRLFPDLDFKQITERYTFATADIDRNSTDYVDGFNTIGWEGASRIVKALPKVNALYFMNDYMAIGGANFLVRNGFEVGKDMLVAGYNNIHSVKFYPFPISSVEHDLERMVSLLAEESLITTPCQHIIEPIVHIRTTNAN